MHQLYMNNIFLNNDPLLYNRNNQYQDPNEIYNLIYRNKLVDIYSQDTLGDIDNIIRDLDQNVVSSLQNDDEWKQLNTSLQLIIQSEIVGLVKYRLNNNPNVIDNVNKLKEIIKKHQQTIKDTERQNIAELNDYMKNYSNMSFDDYKKIKGNK